MFQDTIQHSSHAKERLLPLLNIYDWYGTRDTVVLISYTITTENMAHCWLFALLEQMLIEPCVVGKKSYRIQDVLKTFYWIFIQNMDKWRPRLYSVVEVTSTAILLGTLEQASFDNNMADFIQNNSPQYMILLYKIRHIIITCGIRVIRVSVSASALASVPQQYSVGGNKFLHKNFELLSFVKVN